MPVDALFNADASYISISKTAGGLLQRLLGHELKSFEEVRKCVVGAAMGGDISTVESTKELHFLAKANLRGRECYLLCVARDGSPAQIQPVTVIVKGVMLPDDAKHLISLGKGLAPIGSSISAQRREA